MNGVGGDAFREVGTDGARSSLGGVGGANEGSEIRHGIVLLEDGRDIGPLLMYSVSSPKKGRSLCTA